jgi:hypothetical protein
VFDCLLNASDNSNGQIFSAEAAAGEAEEEAGEAEEEAGAAAGGGGAAVEAAGAAGTQTGYPSSPIRAVEERC